MAGAPRPFSRAPDARDPVVARIDATRLACSAALERPDDGPPAGARPVVHLATPRRRDEDAVQATARVRQYAASAASAGLALAHLPEDGPARAEAVREDLLRTALAALVQLPGLPVAATVKVRVCEVFRMFCERPRSDTDNRFRPDSEYHARALSACATLTRFPAGQLDWEVSGVPRSYLLKIPFRHLPRVCRTIAFTMRGLRPCYVGHMGVRRYPLLFVEAENHRSYHRMAQSMALQPEVKALLMTAWFHSPETIRVSPHLAWTNRTPLAHGAILTDIGPAAPGDGFLMGSPDRQRLYDAGLYRPTVGVIIWPRPALLAWAAAHPEFGVEADNG